MHLSSSFLLIIYSPPAVKQVISDDDDDNRRGQQQRVKPVSKSVTESAVTRGGRTTTKEEQEQEEEPKVILFWTKYYDREDFTFGIGREPFIKAKCPVTNCIATADRSWLNRTDAVLFHALQFDNHDLPATRSSNQRFVFYLFETIPNTTVPCVGKCLPEDRYTPHYFNWTMTHRRDSDVYIAEPYGSLVPIQPVLPAQMPDDLPDGTNSPPPDPASLLNQPRFRPQLTNRTRLVAWFNSHCPTHSQREDYVQQLAKHVQVDIYGKCGHMQCLPRNDPKCEHLLNNYKFYLAMENSLCPDYVTEKFYRSLDNGIVPIVYGGADYTQYAPPHSYINVADFPSPKHLADYLLMLHNNDALYLRYFEWRKSYKVVRSPKKGWCDLCAKLNSDDAQSSETAKSYDDVGLWWVRQRPCYPGSSFLQNHNEL